MRAAASHQAEAEKIAAELARPWAPPRAAPLETLASQDKYGHALLNLWATRLPP